MPDEQTEQPIQPEPVQPVEPPKVAPKPVPEFPGIQPEDIKYFPMTPEVRFRNVSERWAGHKRELVTTQIVLNNLNVRIEETDKQIQKMIPKMSVGAALARLIHVGPAHAITGGPSKEELNVLKQRLQGLEQNMVTAQWRVMVLNDGVASIERAFINSGKELLEWKTEGGVALLREELRTPELVEWANSLFNRVRNSMREAELKRTKNILNKPNAGIVNIDDLTTAEILKALSTPTVSRLPEGVTVSDLRDALGKTGFDDKKIQDALDTIQSDMEERLTAWANILDGQYNHSISLTEELKLTAGEQALLALTQPMLAVGEAFEIYEQKWARPFAWMGTRGLTWIEAKLGSDVAARQMYDLDAAYQQAKNEGHYGWEAMGYGFENWDTNWFQKIASEIIFDPLTYLDIGLSFKVISKLPMIGRYSRYIGAFEDGYNRIADLPINAISKLAKKVPFSITTRAGFGARRTALNLLGAVQESSGKLLQSNFTRDDIMKAGMAALQLRRTNPRRMIRPIEKFGADLWNMLWKDIDADGLADLAARLGSTKEFNDELLHDLGQTIARLGDMSAVPKDALARQLAITLDVDNWQEALKYLDEIMEGIESGARTLLEGENFNKIYRQVFKKSYDDYFGRYTAKQATKHAARHALIAQREGMTWAFMQNTFDDVVGSKWLSRWNFYVDRMIVLPVARHVLIFGAYAPMNLVESGLRVGLRGYNPWIGFRRGAAFAHAEINAIWFKGVNAGFMPTEQALGIFGESSMEMWLKATPRGLKQTPGEWLASHIPGITWMPKEFKVPFTDKHLNIESWKLEEGNKIAAKWATSQRHFTLRSIFKRQLGEVAPEELAQITAARGARMKQSDFPSFSKTELRGIDDLVDGAVVSDPSQLIDFVPNRALLSARKLDGAVAEALDELDTLDEFTTNAIRQLVANGDMTADNAEEMMELVIERVMEGHVGKMARASAGTREFFKEFADWTPKDKKDFLSVIEQLGWYESDVMPRVIEDTFASVTVAGRTTGMKDAQRTALHKEAQKLMREYFKETQTAIKTMRERMTKFSNLLEPDEFERLVGRMDSWDKNLVKLNSTREKTWKILNDYSALPKGERSREGQQAAYAEVENVWNKYRRAEGAQMAENDAFMRKMSTDPFIPDIRADVPDMRKGLTLEHVAKIFSTTPDQVSHNLYSPDTVSLMGLDRFVGYVRARAGNIAKDARLVGDITDPLKAADNIGFSEVNVEKVYKSILRSNGMNPDDIPQMAPIVEQLRGFAHTFTKLWDSRMVPEDEVLRLQRHLGEIAERVSDLPMYRDVAPTVAKAAPSDLPIASVEDATAKLAKAEAKVADTPKGSTNRLKGAQFERDMAQVELEAAQGAEKLAKVPKRAVEPTPEYAAKRQAAAEASTNEFHQIYTDYTDGSMFASMMKRVYPFWTYESQRLPWLAQAYLRHPALVGANLSRYMDYTDGGYITIPGTDLQINPFRGTIFMGGMRRLWVKDYPEYYDAAPFAGAAEVLDGGGRYGFYINFLGAAALSTFGAAKGKPEWGEILVPHFRTAMNMAASAPGFIGDAAIALREKVFSDRFRLYNNSQAANVILTEMGLKGTTGSEMFAKLELGIEFTPDEKRVWRKAEKRMAKLGILMEQTGMLRYRPEEREEVYELAEQAMADILNVDIRVLQRIRKMQPVTGKSVYDVFQMTSNQMEQVRSMDNYLKWNSGLVTPLLPSEWRAEDTRRTLYYKEMESIREQANVTGFSGFAGAYSYTTGEKLTDGAFISHEWLHNALRDDRINGNTFLELSKDLYTTMQAQVNLLSNLEEFKDVPKTLEERLIYWDERGRPSSTYHPETELRWLYYQIELKRDPETAKADWDSYYAQLTNMVEALPEDRRPVFEEALMANWTNSRKLYWRDSREYFQAYRNIRLLVLKRFTPEQIQLIETFRQRPESPEGRRIRDEEMYDEKTKLVAHYDALLSTGHKNMRMLDPELDGRLRFWGKVLTPATDEGDEVYLRLLQERSGA